MRSCCCGAETAPCAAIVSLTTPRWAPRSLVLCSAVLGKPRATATLSRSCFLGARIMFPCPFYAFNRCCCARNSRIGAGGYGPLLTGSKTTAAASQRVTCINRGINQVHNMLLIERCTLRRYHALVVCYPVPGIRLYVAAMDARADDCCIKMRPVRMRVPLLYRRPVLPTAVDRHDRLLEADHHKTMHQPRITQQTNTGAMNVSMRGCAWCCHVRTHVHLACGPPVADCRKYQQRCMAARPDNTPHNSNILFAPATSSAGMPNTRLSATHYVQHPETLASCIIIRQPSAQPACPGTSLQRRGPVHGCSATNGCLHPVRDTTTSSNTLCGHTPVMTNIYTSQQHPSGTILPSHAAPVQANPRSHAGQQGCSNHAQLQEPTQPTPQTTSSGCTTHPHSQQLSPPKQNILLGPNDSLLGPDTYGMLLVLPSFSVLNQEVT